MTLNIAFQGIEGSYSHLACMNVFGEDVSVLPCSSFMDAFSAVEEGRASHAMIPIENGTAGRVTDIHRILPNTKLTMVKEHFQPVEHCLLAAKDATMETIQTAESHIQALMQSEINLRSWNLGMKERADTALAAKDIADSGDNTRAAVASKAAAKLYDLQILKENIEDIKGNTTRFVIFTKEKNAPKYNEDTRYVTSFLFEVKHIPAALYKALGGFATNGINMVRLESYMGQNFNNTHFYAEILGHTEQVNVARAFEELAFYSKDLKLLGIYEADETRLSHKRGMNT
jgi:prephenate dehydratase